MSRYGRIDLLLERATRAARTCRIALAVDTSGLIDESLLRRFVAEVAAVLEKAEPMLRLIVCDADVHQVHDFSGREGANPLRGFDFKGGGGTDFKPAIAEAAKWKPDHFQSCGPCQKAKRRRHGAKSSS